MVPSQSSNQKMDYESPEFTEKGGIAELTQQTVKTVGLSDGFVLAPDNTPLSNLS